MAALSRAGFGAGGGIGGGKDLTCGVCREVYRSPRILPCFHTFCLCCVQELTGATNHQPFPCPTCGKPTALPPGCGALGYQVNPYITEEELQQARDSPGTTPCRRSGHDGRALVLYCERCQEAICTVCKMTRHENHPTNALAEVAARCRRKLEEMKGPLEDTIRLLTDRSALVNDSIQDSQPGERVKAQILAQHDLLVAKVGRWRDDAFVEVDRSHLKTKGKLTTDAARVQRELDSLLQLGQRVQRAMNDASDAETVEVEREMRTGCGNKTNLQAARDTVLDPTVRCSRQNFDPAPLDDGGIRRLLGFPTEVRMPLGFQPFMVPVYQCDPGLQVNSLRHQDGEMIEISYGKNTSGCERRIKLSMGENMKVCSMPLSLNGPDRGDHLSDKRGFFRLQTDQTSLDNRESKWWVVRIKDNNWGFIRHAIRVHNPIACDVMANLPLFVVVDTSVTRKAKRDVLVFCEPSMYTYKPPNTDFHPTDVCFWTERGETKLLVADSGNSSVHIVRLGHLALSMSQKRSLPSRELVREFCFERYLAPGDPHLVHPTALNVDDDGRVWVGCGKGWILRCEHARRSAEPCRVGVGQKLGVMNGSRSRSFAVDSASVAALSVENGSQSGVDSASVAALSVENGSQSGVDSASVAALSVENSSQSGVDSASVAALSVENGSQSGVDSASVAALSVENDSQSGVDSASVAALSVGNGSQSGVDSASVAALSVENGTGVDSASVAALSVENDSQSGVDSASVSTMSTVRHGLLY